MSLRSLAFGLALLLGGVVSAVAADPAGEARAPGRGGVLSLLPEDAITQHSLDVGGTSIAYVAAAGTLDLFGQDGERNAAIFYTSYVAKDKGPDRPITFVFNGGPGAASAFLNLGLVGPRILDFGAGGHDGADAKLIDNPQSWLQFTDLVLIDPIGTGWSRTAKADDASNYYGVRADADSLAKAIALYVAHSGRSSSPKYLLGESYGGLRAAKVASALRQDQGIMISGIVMLSPLIEGSLVFGADRLALGAALQLPSLAAGALERRHAFSEAAMPDIEAFALGDYLSMLAGPAPKGETARAFYARVAEMTDIPVDVVTRTRGFLGDVYIKNSAGGADVVSAYDAGFVAPDAYPETLFDHGDDPVLDGFVRAYGGAFASYARNELGFHTDMTYALLSNAVNGHWDWSGGRGGGGSRSEASGTDDIRELLSLTPSFRLLIAQGYGDMVIPYSVSRYVVDHLPPEANGRVELKLYRGGHMFYTSPQSRAAFTADAKAFFEAGSKVSPAGPD